MWGRHRGSRQDVLVLTAQGDIAEACYDAGPGCIIDYKNGWGWELDYTQLFEYKGKPFQLICEWDKSPIQVYASRPRHESDTADNIFFRKVKEALSKLESNSHNNSIILWLGIIATIFAISISLVVYFKLKDIHAARQVFNILRLYV